MDTNEIQAISFESRIKNIDVDSFTVEKIDSKIKLKSSDFTFEFKIDLAFTPDKNIINIKLFVVVFSDLTKELKLAELISKGEFEILNYSDLLSTYNGMPNIVLSTLIGVLVSTSRGFLILKSKGTIIEGSIFPMLDPMQFFNNKKSNEV